MTKKRFVTQIDNPKGHQGFLGTGHTARSVIERDYKESDPFILLMDDVLDLNAEKPVGGPHPHAGFETVTLILEGEIGDGIHTIKEGDFQMMTAGSGVIHSETINKKTKVRTLQLWLNLPAKDRAVAPRHQDLPKDHVPSQNQGGVQIKLFSGQLSGLTSPVSNYTPLVMAEITLQPGVTSVQQVPANFNTFIYVITGAVRLGSKNQLATEGQVAWLNVSANEEPSDLELVSDDSVARFILYAGKPLGEPFVSQGPFIADTQEEIARLYREYRHGSLKHISTFPPGQRLRL